MGVMIAAYAARKIKNVTASVEKKMAMSTAKIARTTGRILKKRRTRYDRTDDDHERNARQQSGKSQ